MAVYRCDVQVKIASDLIPTGIYYWTNVFYGIVTDGDSFDLFRDNCNQVMARAHSTAVESDRVLITNTATGEVVQHGAFHFSTNPAFDTDYISIQAVIRVNLFAAGICVGNKQFRVPVPSSAVVDGLLTPEFADLYAVTGPGDYLATGFCTKAGVIIDGSAVDPRLRFRQIRHGTKRSERRAV